MSDTVIVETQGPPVVLEVVSAGPQGPQGPIGTVTAELTALAAAASASATAAAASYDSFDDRYLGAKATAPTLDNDGNALLTGAIYWNTASSQMFVWSGSAWINYEATSVAAAATATTQGGIATAQATTATTQAGIATTQAGTATTQAGISTTQATLSTTARVAAEAARDAAFGNANVYASTALGLANTTNGQQFQVIVGRDIVRYQNTSGSAVEVARYPTSSAVFDDTERDRIAAVRSQSLDLQRGPYVPAPSVIVATSPTVIISPPDKITVWTLTNAAVNADGTITIQAGGTMLSPTLLSSYFTATKWIYFWITEREPSYSLNPLTFESRYNSAGLLPSGSRTYAEVENGVHKIGQVNNNGSGSTYNWMDLLITNTGASAVTIYPVMATLLNTAYAPRYRRFDDVQPPAVSAPVKRFDWWNQWQSEDTAARRRSEKFITKSADSVNGLSGNAGTSLRAPKQTIASLPSLASGDIIGLWRGSFWRERFPDISSLQDVIVRDAQVGQMGKRLPIISALRQIPNTVGAGSDWVDNANGSWSFTWTPAETLVNDGYNVVYAVEIKTADESSKPVTSQQRMMRVASAATVATTAGSDFAESVGGGQWKITIRPTDGLAPGSGAYRYEVTDRRYSAYFRNDPAGRHVEGLELVGACDGYGQLALPFDSLLDRSILIHGTAHQAVIFSGVVQRSLFAAANNYEGPPLTFYSPDPQGRAWACRETFFYNTTAIYAHFSSGTPYSRGDVKKIAAIGTRNAANALSGAMLSAQNTDQFVVEDCVIQNSALGALYGNATTVRNNLFRNIAKHYIPKLFENNITRHENWNDATDVNNRGTGILATAAASNAVSRNNLFHHKYVAFSPVLNSDTAANIFINTTVNYNRNIYVVDMPNGFNFVQITSGVSPLYSSDYNLFVLVSGVDPSLFVSGGATQIGWDDYKTGSGQDVNSRFIDLRGDPRGVKALFNDPDNGDFRWAATELAFDVALWCMTNNVGPNWTLAGWPAIPTADEAAQMIRDL